MPQPKRRILLPLMMLVAGFLLGPICLYAGFWVYARHISAKNQQATAKTPITGAFGFVLGQKLDDAIEARPDEDGAGRGR